MNLRITDKQELAMCNPRMTKLLNRVDLLLQALALAGWFYLIFLMASGHPIPPHHGPDF